MNNSDSANKSSTCVVGYALNAKKLRKSSHDGTTNSGKGGEPHKTESVENRKPSEYNWKGGGLSDILESSLSLSGNLVSDSVTFVQLDYEIPLTAQPKCDVIIHKLTEDIDNNSKESVAKIKLIDAYLKEFPRTVIVDPLSCVRKVISRARTCEHLSNIQRRLGKNCSFTQPAYIIAEEGEGTQEMVNQLAEKGLSYPLICKPIQACGTPHSHNMVNETNELSCKYVTVNSATFGSYYRWLLCPRKTCTLSQCRVWCSSITTTTKACTKCTSSTKTSWCSDVSLCRTCISAVATLAQRVMHQVVLYAACLLTVGRTTPRIRISCRAVPKVRRWNGKTRQRRRPVPNWKRPSRLNSLVSFISCYFLIRELLRELLSSPPILRLFIFVL